MSRLAYFLLVTEGGELSLNRLVCGSWLQDVCSKDKESDAQGTLNSRWVGHARRHANALQERPFAVNVPLSPGCRRRTQKRRRGVRRFRGPLENAESS